MKKIEAERIAKQVSSDPTDKLVNSIQDLVENRNQDYEYVEEVSERADDEDEFFMIVIREVLLDGTSYQGMKEINRNLKEKLDEVD